MGADVNRPSPALREDHGPGPKIGDGTHGSRDVAVESDIDSRLPGRWA